MAENSGEMSTTTITTTTARDGTSSVAVVVDDRPSDRLDRCCMGMVSLQSKRATWRRFPLQPFTNPGGQSRKPVEALLWTPPG
eukprot:COSAG06_NODE_3365_length_5449_cov_2.510280_10_plen_83_part_00